MKKVLVLFLTACLLLGSVCFAEDFDDVPDSVSTEDILPEQTETEGMYESDDVVSEPVLKDISSCSAVLDARFVYTGSRITPPVTVYENGAVLDSANYSVAYENNKHVGTAVVIVTGRGDYEGQILKNFKIVPRPTNLTGSDETKSKITAKWKKASGEYDGYQLQYSLDKTFDNAKTFSRGKVTSAKFKKLNKEKRHFIRIRTYKFVDDVKYFSDWSKPYKTDGFITASSYQYAAVKTAKAFLYSEHSKQSAVKKKLGFGKHVRVLKTKGRWLYVLYAKGKKNETGYLLKNKTVLYNINKKHIALTFDDGPNAATTPIVLNALEKNHCRATFFMLGMCINKNTMPLIKREKALGCELGNHTFNHKQLTRLNSGEITAQVRKTDALIQAACRSSATVCRAPYGAADESVLRAMHKPHILWSVDTLDWKHRNTGTLISHVRSHKRDGAIVLMHDIHPSTAHGIDAICKDLNKSGYETVTVTELAAIKDIKLKNGVTYREFH